jgi:hypothetical protein
MPARAGERLIDRSPCGTFREYVGFDETGDRLYQRFEHDATAILDRQKATHSDKRAGWWTEGNGRELCDIPLGVALEWKAEGFDIVTPGVKIDKKELLRRLNGEYAYLKTGG